MGTFESGCFASNIDVEVTKYQPEETTFPAWRLDIWTADDLIQIHLYDRKHLLKLAKVITRYLEKE